jgi:hypothetical protein
MSTKVVLDGSAWSIPATSSEAELVKTNCVNYGKGVWELRNKKSKYDDKTSYHIAVKTTPVAFSNLF